MEDFVLTQGKAYFIGKNIETARHKHHALEFIFGIDKPFDIHTDGLNFNDVYGVVINPNYPHKFVGGDARYLFVFLEPELLATNQINLHYKLSKNKIVPIKKLASFPNPKMVTDFSFFADILKVTNIHIATTKTDARINNSLEYIKTNLDQGQISADSLAYHSHLSTSRFCHLFREQIGIPLRRYVLWCRVQKAVEELLKGGNLTESAHAAGFSDSAHFSRTFSEMFGVSPSSVLKR